MTFSYAQFIVPLVVIGVFILAVYFKRREISQGFRIFRVGISGKIGSGKSTLAANLTKSLAEQKYMVYERNFGDELKQAVAKHYNFDVQLCYSQAGKNTLVPTCNQTVGRILQQYGTEQREIDEDVWVNAVDDYIAKKTSQENIRQLSSLGYIGIVFIIADVRFPNEANWLSQDCSLIRLNGDPQQVFATTTRDKQHISETALDDYDAFDLVMNTDLLDANACEKIARELILEN